MFQFQADNNEIAALGFDLASNFLISKSSPIIIPSGLTRKIFNTFESASVPENLFPVPSKHRTKVLVDGNGP